MPGVSLEQLVISFRQCAKAAFSPKDLAEQLISYAYTNTPGEKLPEKRDVLRLIHEHKQSPFYPALLIYLRQYWQCPAEYSWKLGLYGNHPQSLVVIDSIPNEGPDEKKSIVTSAWSLERSHAAVEKKPSRHHTAIASLGNTTTLCVITNAKNSEPNKLARRAAKQLARLCNGIQDLALFQQKYRSLFEDVQTLVKQSATSNTKIYGMVVRFFPNPDAADKLICAYAAVGRCDLLIYQAEQRMLQHMHRAVVRPSTLCNEYGFQPFTFKDLDEIEFKKFVVNRADRVVMTNVVALESYEQTPQLFTKDHEGIPGPVQVPRSLTRISSHALDELNENYQIFYYAQNYDLPGLENALSDTTQLHRVLFGIALDIAKHRIHKHQNTLTKLWQAYEGLPSNQDGTLLTLQKTLETTKPTELTGTLINDLLYAMGHEIDSTRFFSMNLIKQPDSFQDLVSNIPSFCYSVLNPDCKGVDITATIAWTREMLTFAIQQRADRPHLIRLKQSGINDKVKQLLFGKTGMALTNNASVGKLIQDAQHAFLQVADVEKTLTHQIYAKLQSILWIIQFHEDPSLASLKKEAKKLYHAISLLLPHYTNAPYAHNAHFSAALRQRALRQPFLMDDPIKQLYLVSIDLLPAGSLYFPSRPDNPKDNLDKLLALWYECQQTQFKQSNSLQSLKDQLTLACNHGYAFAYYLQALLILKQNKHLTEPLLKEVLVWLKKAIDESLEISVIALEYLLSQDAYIPLFNAIPFSDERAEIPELNFINWANFLVESARKLLLPEQKQMTIGTLLNQGIERLGAVLAKSALDATLKQVQATLPGYLAYFLWQRHLPQNSIDYATMAIEKRDPLGWYILLALSVEYRDTQDSQITQELKHMLDADNPHHQWVQLLVTTLNKPDQQESALQDFSDQQPNYPQQIYLNCKQATFFSATNTAPVPLAPPSRTDKASLPLQANTLITPKILAEDAANAAQQREALLSNGYH